MTPFYRATAATDTIPTVMRAARSDAPRDISFAKVLDPNPYARASIAVASSSARLKEFITTGTATEIAVLILARIFPAVRDAPLARRASFIRSISSRSTGTNLRANETIVVRSVTGTPKRASGFINRSKPATSSEGEVVMVMKAAAVTSRPNLHATIKPVPSPSLVTFIFQTGKGGTGSPPVPTV